MSETAISVAEAAKDFQRLLELVEGRGESAVILRDGRPVAILRPVSKAAITCAELAERWPNLEKLSSKEGNEFADDLDHARASLPPVKPAWD